MLWCKGSYSEDFVLSNARAQQVQAEAEEQMQVCRPPTSGGLKTGFPGGPTTCLFSLHAQVQCGWRRRIAQVRHAPTRPHSVPARPPTPLPQGCLRRQQGCREELRSLADRTQAEVTRLQEALAREQRQALHGAGQHVGRLLSLGHGVGTTGWQPLLGAKPCPANCAWPTLPPCYVFDFLCGLLVGPGPPGAA